MDNDESDSSSEVESQFILRLPSGPARVLREALRNENSLENRVSINIEDDLRHAEVQVDQWRMSGKVVNLPTIVESLKTVDGKKFYKTADISQMLVCKEEDNQATAAADENTPQEEKKAPDNAENKYLWPHGITPPTNNIRKKRFRKKFKKGSADASIVERELVFFLPID